MRSPEVPLLRRCSWPGCGAISNGNEGPDMYMKSGKVYCWQHAGGVEGLVPLARFVVVPSGVQETTGTTDRVRPTGKRHFYDGSTGFIDASIRAIEERRDRDED